MGRERDGGAGGGGGRTTEVNAEQILFKEFLTNGLFLCKEDKILRRGVKFRDKNA